MSLLSEIESSFPPELKFARAKEHKVTIEMASKVRNLYQIAVKLWHENYALNADVIRLRHENEFLLRQINIKLNED